MAAKVNKTCGFCGKEFSVLASVLKRGRGKFCSRVCVSKNTFWKGGKRKKVCKTCNEAFFVFPSREKKAPVKYCSDDCYPRSGSGNPNWKGGNIEKVCGYCGGSYFIFPVEEKNRDSKFCSRSCLGKSRVKEENPNWGKGEKIKGKNNPNWKGGISPINVRLYTSKEYKRWREFVFERDEYTCQECDDDKGGNLQAHHIIPRSANPELMFDKNNGTTLCKPCHIDVHRVL